MIYRQPGIKITQEKNTSLIGAIGAVLPVCLVGSGFSTLTKTFKVVRSSEVYDAIVDADGDYVTLSSIIKVGNTKGSTDYNIGDHLTDYVLNTVTIDNVSVTVVDWTGVEGSEKPVSGDSYYVEAVITPAAKHYELKQMSSTAEVIAEYGPDVDASGNINDISLAAQIMLENTASIYMIKAAKAGDALTPTELNVALEKLTVAPEPYRIVLADSPLAALNLAVLNHVRLMSDPDEGLERVALFSTEHASSTSTDVITNVGGYAAALNEFRTCVFYPDKAKRTLSDGNKYVLHGGFVAASLASMKSSLSPQESYTGKQITNFDELVGVSMTKSQKNTLAANGVMILEQVKAGYPIEVRHGLSTDMSSIQMREISVTEIADFVSRSIRPALKNYKGQVINKSLLTQIEGSVTAVINTLVRQGNILNGSAVTNVYQVELAPDTVAVEVRVKVPYPCNYIDIVVAYE